MPQTSFAYHVVSPTEQHLQRQEPAHSQQEGITPFEEGLQRMELQDQIGPVHADDWSSQHSSEQDCMDRERNWTDEVDFQ